MSCKNIGALPVGLISIFFKLEKRFIYYINGRRLSVTEVRALYECLNCGWLGGGLRVATLATVGSGRGWLGAVVARQAAGCNGR